MNALHQGVGVPMWTKKEGSFISTVNISFSFISCSANEGYLHSRHKKEKHSLADQPRMKLSSVGSLVIRHAVCRLTYRVNVISSQRSNYKLHKNVNFSYKKWEKEARRRERWVEGSWPWAQDDWEEQSRAGKHRDGWILISLGVVWAAVRGKPRIQTVCAEDAQAKIFLDCFSPSSLSADH